MLPKDPIKILCTIEIKKIANLSRLDIAIGQLCFMNIIESKLKSVTNHLLVNISQPHIFCKQNRNIELFSLIFILHFLRIIAKIATRILLLFCPTAGRKDDSLVGRGKKTQWPSGSLY